MRPIPAPRIGESHGLLRAISTRDRVRLDEFVTEFQNQDLYPPGLENAQGRTRQFVSYARSAGLLKEDRGVVELTEIGKRYIRAGDNDAPFEVSEAQADWLRRQLLEKHMTDSIYHGLAIGLSLLSSVPPGTRVSMLDFGRSLSYLGRAGWDNDNTLQGQGERYLALMADMRMIDDQRALTPTGQDTKNELTLPIHMSMTDIAAQLNPGGADAVRAEGEAEWAELHAQPEPEAEPEPEPAPAAPAAPPAPEPAAVADDDEDEWQDVGPGAPKPAPAPEPAPAPAAAAGPPTPPADIWETAEPDDATSTYTAVGAAAPKPAEPAPEPEPPAMPGMTSGDPLAGAAAVPPPVEPPPPAPPVEPAPPAPPVEPPPPAPPVEPPPPPPPVEPPPPPVEPAPPAPPTPPVETAPHPPPPAPEPPRPQDEATVVSRPAGPAPAAAAPPPRLAEVPPPPPRQPSGFLDAGAIRAAAEGHGLRLPSSAYASLAAALAAGRHVVLTGPPGSGKTALALAVARAAVTSGRAGGAVLFTPTGHWSSGEALGRPASDGRPATTGTVPDAATRGRWLVIDELDRAKADKALGGLSTFLGGLPVTLPGGDEVKPPADWRVVATAGRPLKASPALARRFAHIEVPFPSERDMTALLEHAAGGDHAAANAAERLLPLRELQALGAGVFIAAAAYCAERNAIEPADERALAREAYSVHVEPLLAGLDDRGQDRLKELLGAL
jgi:energy-coupling factor transporter ATP-binding protein EcfA2